MVQLFLGNILQIETLINTKFTQSDQLLLLGHIYPMSLQKITFGLLPISTSPHTVFLGHKIENQFN